MIRMIKRTAVEPVLQWQTIYCSLMLLLVVFFVMLIAYSTIDRDRFLNVRNMALSKPAQEKARPNIGQAIQSLRELSATVGLKEGIPVFGTGDGFKAVIPNPVLFGSGDASLNTGVEAILDGIAGIAIKNHLAIEVEGHTDGLPIETAQFPSNWELSTMRAVNILRYLQQNGGVPANRLVAVGFAEHHPVASNDTPTGRQKNRRIEIIFRPER